MAKPKEYRMVVAVDRDLRDRVNRAAAADRRPVSQWVRLQCERACDQAEGREE